MKWGCAEPGSRPPPIGWIWIRGAIGQSERESAPANRKASRAASGGYKRGRGGSVAARESRQQGGGWWCW